MSVLTYVDYESTAPTIEPVDVPAVRRNCDVDDSYRDIDFARWITEARKQIEHDSRICLVNSTRIRKLDAFPAEDYIPLRKPLVSVSSIAYLDTGGSSQTWASSNYEVDTNRHVVWLAYSQSYPDTRDIQNAVTITYVCGHGATRATVPEAAVAAIHLFCRMRHDAPTTPVDDWTATNAYQSLINQLKRGDYP